MLFKEFTKNTCTIELAWTRCKQRKTAYALFLLRLQLGILVKEEIVRLTGRHRWAAILFATAIFSLDEYALRNAAASFVMGAGA